jgi:hypothetical protein
MDTWHKEPFRIGANARTIGVPAGVEKLARLAALKTPCPKGRVGSNPTARTHMRLPSEVIRVHQLRSEGLSYTQIARETGIPRPTIVGWIRTRRWLDAPPSPTFRPQDLPPPEYAYLLGIYLGDGTVLRFPKDVWALHVFQDDRYPGIVAEIVAAIQAVMPTNRVKVYEKYRGANMSMISCYSKRWPLVLPQTGPGMKHTRKIELTAWQWGYVWQQPERFLRGLIHSDGCRVMNKVWHGKYAYPRYFFNNESRDIQQLFRDTCDLLGIEHRNNRSNSISVAKRASVARLDEFVGPKR